jgi:DNA-directed RNA polymerase II subunit RPB1
VLSKKVSLEGTRIFIFDEENGKTVLHAEDVLNIFEKLSDETIINLGLNPKFSHPKNMILTVIPVSPPQVRPTINMDSTIRSQDDMTHKLIEILKANSLVSQIEKNYTNYVYIESINLLQFHVSTYIDNELPGQMQATQRTGRPIKGICQRLKTKEGRIRNNLMGKRVNFSARTVITAEPNIDLDELGVPHTIAKNLTFPETVTSWNMGLLQQYVDNGPECEIGTIGAKYVISPDGIRKDLRFVKNGCLLNIGDTVERHMKDGDLVIFNRQPTLHKMSMMGHRTKIMKHSTFRMNLSATSPYNADFDGDEMNLHMPQSYITKAEIENLMAVPNNIVSGQSNRPVIGIVQDALLSCSKLTSDTTFIKRSDFMSIYMKIRRPLQCIDFTINTDDYFTGKQLMNIIIPHNFNFKRKNNFGEIVVIENGKYESGRLCKKSLGTSEGGIIHLLWLLYGPREASNFISDLQYICNNWILQHGFSIGISDTFTHSNTQKKVKNAFQLAEERVNQIIEVSSTSDNPLFESKINQVLNNAMSNSGRCVQDDINDSNNIHQMVCGGSKGSMINIAQIMGMVGQQNVGGKRITFGYVNRALPHFKKNDKSAAARGFVKNSYLQGLDPNEFFYHAMGGREGIIDTAVKTSETGYIERRLIKAMEDLTISQDRSFRNSIGDILQFIYGEDGMDASKLLNQKFKVLDDSDFVTSKTSQREISTISSVMKEISKWSKNKTEIHFRSPIILDYLLAQASHTSPLCNDHNHIRFKQKDSVKIFNLVNETVNKLSPIPFDKNNSSVVDLINSNSTLFIRGLIWSHLNSKNVIKLKFSEVTLTEILHSIKKMYLCGLAVPGEMMGTISAQSLAEPVTQLTLNSFHFSGISAKSITLGVPRFKELINVAKIIKSPTMTIHIKDCDKTNTDNVATSLERCIFNDFISMSEIIETEHSVYDSIPDDFEAQEWCPLSIKYTIDLDALLNTGLTLLCVSTIISNRYESFLKISHGSENVRPVTMTVTPIKGSVVDDEMMDSILDLSLKLKNRTILKGFQEISKIYINDDSTLDSDGICLQQILSHEAIDANKTVSNQPLEILEVLGVEATRQVLLNEIRKVLEFDGGYVNYRHFASLVDTMTYRGHIMSITRHGINRGDTGPLMRCSFEETVDVLMDAAMFSERDNIRGVAESITVGKLSKVGTGCFDIFVDDSFYSNEPEDVVSIYD